MVDFAGFKMPVHYNTKKGGIIQEHLAVRNKAGVFDVSHMGNFFISGAGASNFLDKVCTGSASGLATGKALYTLICNEQGCPLDDLIIYKVGEGSFYAIVNASNVEKDFAWMSAYCPVDVLFENRSEEFSIFALQGPEALSIFLDLAGQSADAMDNFSLGEFEWEGEKIQFSRTGYTGESGVEICPPNSKAISLWNALMEKGASRGLIPIGLGARDTLRLEMGYSLYGHELNEEINALESGLGWVVDFNKPDFIGKEALVKAKTEGLKKKLIGVKIFGKAIPRAGYKILKGRQEIGVLTSGTRSPSLGYGIGLGYIAAGTAKNGETVSLDIRGKAEPVELVRRQFYQKTPA